MHTKEHSMLRKKVAAVAEGSGAKAVFTPRNLLIHLFINQIYSL